MLALNIHIMQVVAKISFFMIFLLPGLKSMFMENENGVVFSKLKAFFE